MQVEINTDNHIEGNDDLFRRVESEVAGALDRFGDQIIRVIVQLNDTNAHKSGDHDKRCLMEARIAGHQPVAVSHEAASLEGAISAAAEKLERSLDHILGKLGQKKGRTSFGGDQTF
jgi:ribosome-associated translation inhibitor RaiA